MQILFGSNQYETPGLMISEAEWTDIIDLCDDARCIVRERSEKWKTGWISPAILNHDATSRRNTDVSRMSDWIGLDLDHAGWSLETMLERFRSVECVIYSTTKSTLEHPRWRVLVALSREMTTAEFTGVWKALDGLLGGAIDPSTKNLNRLHYLPAQWQGGNNVFRVIEGQRVDVDALLECCPPEEPAYYDVAKNTGDAGVNVPYVPVPTGTRLITPAMIDRHMTGLAGGRFFKLLCAAAAYARRQGWTLSPSELANEALSVSPIDSSGLRRAMGAYREAMRAISYINSRVEAKSPLERLREKLEWRMNLAETQSTKENG